MAIGSSRRGLHKGVADFDGYDRSMDDEMGEALLRQSFDFWINPELERRKAAGELDERFVLRGAQVIFDPDSAAPEIRLNEEVRAVAEIEAARDLEKGQAVTGDDIASFKSFLLTEDDPNVGHVTLILHGDSWVIGFDFRRNAGRIAEHTELAEQFVEAAAWAREQGYARVFVDNLFSAAELMAKAFLIWMPDEQLLNAKSHGLVHARFNQHRKLNNVDVRFALLLNRLTALRGPARYLDSAFSLSDVEQDDILLAARQMHQALEATRPRRATVSS